MSVFAIALAVTLDGTAFAQLPPSTESLARSLPSFDSTSFIAEYNVPQTQVALIFGIDARSRAAFKIGPDYTWAVLADGSRWWGPTNGRLAEWTDGSFESLLRTIGEVAPRIWLRSAIDLPSSIETTKVRPDANLSIVAWFSNDHKPVTVGDANSGRRTFTVRPDGRVLECRIENADITLHFQYPPDTSPDFPIVTEFAGGMYKLTSFRLSVASDPVFTSVDGLRQRMKQVADSNIAPKLASQSSGQPSGATRSSIEWSWVVTGIIALVVGGFAWWRYHRS